jgi:hypothetical protein
VESRPHPSPGAHELDIDAGAILPVAAHDGLWRIVENLNVFHPGFSVVTLDYRPGRPDQLSCNVWFFGSLMRMYVHRAVSPNKKNEAVLRERNPVEELLILRRAVRH